MALDPLTAGIGLVDKFIGKFVKDKDLAAKLSAAAKSEEFAGDLALMKGQLEINKIEAAHKSLFIAGPRPFLMWVCGFGFAYNVLVHPILDIWIEMPIVDPALLYPTLMALLGLGSMRTVEKTKGVAREK